MKDFTINENGGHLGRVTCTIYIKLSFPLPKEAPHEIWLGLAEQFQRRRCLIIMVIYMYIAPGQGQTTPWGQILFINSIIQSI